MVGNADTEANKFRWDNVNNVEVARILLASDDDSDSDSNQYVLVGVSAANLPKPSQPYALVVTSESNLTSSGKSNSGGGVSAGARLKRVVRDKCQAARLCPSNCSFPQGHCLPVIINFILFVHSLHCSSKCQLGGYTYTVH